MFSGFPSGHFSTSVYLNGPTGFSVSPCCSDYQSLNCSFAAMLPKKLTFAASADVSAEQSTPNLGLYMKMYIFTSPYVRDVYHCVDQQGRGGGSGLGDRRGGCTTARSKMLRAEETGYNSLRSDKCPVSSNAFYCSPSTSSPCDPDARSRRPSLAFAGVVSGLKSSNADRYCFMSGEF